MAFDYDKIKADQEQGSHWASYSDLFMVLSLVFLLLYVVASLRNGTMGISQHLNAQKLAEQNADLQEQLRTYNTLKEGYLKTGATTEELDTYENLMDKLKLLKDEANQEKIKLQAAAQENAEKEEALNQYQQIVRNIINANMISRADVKTRDTIIGKQDVEIEEKVKEVKELNQEVAQKEAAIKAGEAQIAQVNQQLDTKVQELQQAYQQQRISKTRMQQEVAKLKEQSQAKLEQLQAQKTELSKELTTINQNLQAANSELKSAKATIEAQGSAISELIEEKNAYSEKMDDLKAQYQAQQQQARAEFEEQMKKQKLSAQARAAKEAEFRAQAQKKAQELSGKLAQLEQKVQGSQEALNDAMAEKNKALESAKALQAKNSAMGKDLKRMQEIANAKKKLIKQISDNLKKAGVDASVDGKTGDVLISFGEEYFETGQAALKPAMKQTLKKFMPMYSQSLLADPKLAEKVKSVEIVGFASPTYKGKFVDPVSLEAKDREAVNYNLDLSYYRARSIFDHIFDTNKMKYKYQKDLLPLVKVTGRSFLADGDRDVASEMSVKEYCKKHNCKKSQRVIIRFEMDH